MVTHAIKPVYTGKRVNKIFEPENVFLTFKFMFVKSVFLHIFGVFSQSAYKMLNSQEIMLLK
jgi:hypothetical protein